MTWLLKATYVSPLVFAAVAVAAPAPEYQSIGVTPAAPVNVSRFYGGAASTPTPTPTPVLCFLGENFDFVTPPALPPGWTATNGIDPDGILWQSSNSGTPSPPADSPPNAAWVNDPDAISDKYLYSPPVSIDPGANALLVFSNNYGLENTFDGGVLEVSVDGGPFQDILAAGGFFLLGGYNGTISICCGNPLAGRQAWTGSSGGFIETDVELTAFHGHTIVLRWRMGSDSSGSSDGWRVDNVQTSCEEATPTPASTPTPTATVTPTATPRPTPRPTPTPRSRPTPMPRPIPPGASPGDSARTTNTQGS